MTLQKEQKNVPGNLLADDIKACFMLAGLMIEPRCKTPDKSKVTAPATTGLATLVPLNDLQPDSLSDPRTLWP